MRTYLYNVSRVVLAAFALTTQTFWQVGYWHLPMLYIVFLTCATAAVYGFPMLWRYQQKNMIVLLVLVLLLLWCCLPFTVKIATALLGLAVGLYYLPFFNIGQFFQPKKSLRSIGMLKIYIVCAVWVAAVGLIPMLYISPPWHTQLAIGLQHTGLIFVSALLYDIRDTDIDTLHHLNTLPVRRGVSFALLCCQITIVLLLLLCVVSYIYIGNTTLAMALGIAYTSIWAIIQNIKQNAMPAKRITFWADVILLLPPIAVGVAA